MKLPEMTPYGKIVPDDIAWWVDEGFIEPSLIIGTYTFFNGQFYNYERYWSGAYYHFYVGCETGVFFGKDSVVHDYRSDMLDSLADKVKEKIDSGELLFADSLEDLKKENEANGGKLDELLSSNLPVRAFKEFNEFKE